MVSVLIANACWGIQISLEFGQFLNMALNEDMLSVSRRGRFTPRQSSPLYSLNAGLGSSQDGVDDSVGKKLFIAFARNRRTSLRSVCQSASIPSEFSRLRNSKDSFWKMCILEDSSKTQRPQKHLQHHCCENIKSCVKYRIYFLE